VPGRPGRGRLLPALRGRAPAPAGRVLAGLPRPPDDVPERLAAGAPAAHAPRVASARAASDPGLAPVPRPPPPARPTGGLLAALLHPLLRSVGAHRARRHGELELRPQGEPRHHRAAVSLQL